MLGHINGTGNKAQGRDDTATKGNKDVGDVGKDKLAAPKKATAPAAKKKIPAKKIIGKIKGLT
ncbi:hypothetical protein UFOVP650_51 [uncultured Caudovirales phage]|uniref:Uncharacterized protein n=1 Tax=uncultured Caudovirales phage TaxID=2100421 RepID=A0A6J5N832_9CAUD|nr:hypothetical protein UFOVP650_51 [uncultured Caudovirales phage]